MRPPVRFIPFVLLVLPLSIGAGCKHPFTADPITLLDRAERQAVDARSVQFDATATIEVDAPRSDGGGREHVKLTLTIVRAQEEPVDGDPRGESTATIGVESNQGSGGITLDARTIGYASYLRIRDLRVQLRGDAAEHQTIVDAMLGAAQGVLGNRWITVDPRKIPELLAGFGVSTGEIPPSPPPEELRARRERYRALARANPVLVLREDLGRAKVDGVRTRHLRVGIRRDALATSSTAVLRELFPLGGASAVRVPPAIVNALERGPIADAIDRLRPEVWIATRDRRFHHTRIPLDLDIPMANDRMRVTGAIDIRSRNWGTSVIVEAPMDAKPLEEVISGFLGGSNGLPSAGDRPVSAPSFPTPQSLPSGRPSGEVQPIPGGVLPPDRDTDGDGLTDTLEHFYGSNPQNPDTDGDGYRDGIEVDRGYSPTGPGRLFDFAPTPPRSVR